MTLIQTAKMENNPTNRRKISNKRCIRARLQYLQRSCKANEAKSRAACFALLQRFSWLTCRCFVRITKFTFPQLTPIIAQVLKEKWLQITGFAHSQITNKLVNKAAKAANDSARVGGQGRKKLPTLGTNQIAGFRGFRPLASLEKNKRFYSQIMHVCISSILLLIIIKWA